ncbi:Excisionase/Xis, DNA-binding protein [gamma proteobacterium HdN1]|nr:Excisionase/Xis, DNA-binding protein [gamma proteobacterium HdN1]
MSAPNKLQLPTDLDIEQAKVSSRTLSKYAKVDHVQLSLRTPNGESDEVILPGIVVQMLLGVLSEVSKGNAVSIIPRHQEVSTQEAANILNVSRPFFVGLLESGEIPFRKVGAHRRVLLLDVLEYQNCNAQRRHNVLDELAELSQAEDMGYSL